MSERLTILWLTSWYPNEADPFDGDFIQRHARVAALHHNIHVIYVGVAPIDAAVEVHWREDGALTEQLVYFRKPEGVLSRLRKQWVWKVLFQKAVQRYIRMHGKPHAIHVHVPWKAGLIGSWASKKWDLPLFITEHWGIYSKSDPQFIGRQPFWMRRMLRRIYRSAGAVTAVSRYLANAITEQTGRRVDHILPNVVDATLFSPASHKGEPFTLLHVSNMAPLKNVGLILEAFGLFVQTAEGAGCRLLLVGNRDATYVERASELGLLHTSVFFRGEVAYGEVAKVMREVHALVLFSDSETFSCVAAEALCSGLPVITSAVGALPELVTEANGWLVASRSVEALAAAMAEAKHNWREKSGAAPAAHAASKYGIEAAGRHFERLYRGE